MEDGYLKSLCHGNCYFTVLGNFHSGLSVTFSKVKISFCYLIANLSFFIIVCPVCSLLMQINLL